MAEKRDREEAAEPEKPHKKAKQCDSHSSDDDDDATSYTGLLLGVDGTQELVEVPPTGLVAGYEALGAFVEEHASGKLEFLTAFDCPMRGRRNAWYNTLAREFDAPLSTTGPILVMDYDAHGPCDLCDATFNIFRQLTPSAEDVASAGDVTTVSDSESDGTEETSLFRAHVARLRDAQLDTTEVILRLVKLLRERGCKTAYCDVCNIVSAEEDVCCDVACGYCKKVARTCRTCDLYIEGMTPVACCLACARQMAAATTSDEDESK